MTNPDLHELVIGYALDALAEDERHDFEAHLPECERCRAELVELSGTVEALALAAEGLAPAEALRERILVTARQERPNVIALRPRRTRIYAGAALAAAACAALAIGLWAGLSGGNGPTRVALTGANGALVVHSSGKAELSVSDLAAAPAGKAYEVWVLADGTVVPAGLFRGGPGTSVVSLTRPVRAGARVAVTLERATGAARPTSRVLFTAQLSA
jgi:hypothetical protein